MLTVGIKDQDELSLCAANARLDCGAVALRVGMSHDLGPGARRTFAGPIARAVVDDEDLFPCRFRPEA